MIFLIKEMNRFHLAIVLILFITCMLCQPRREKVLIQNPKIVFLSNRDAPKRYFDIFIMNMDGSEQTNLTKGWMTIRTTSEPKFSPDQKKILFCAFEDNKKLLQIMDNDGNNKTDLAEVNLLDPQAQFSPDGTKIVYVSKVNGFRQIHIIECNGKNGKNISDNSYNEYEPIFSPDGSKIVFVSEQDGTHSICVMNNDGSNRHKLTDRSGEDRYPHFSPDGSKIAFISKRKGNYDIYIIKTNGRKLKNLTKNYPMESEPKFYPDGSKVLFVSNIRGIRFRDICNINVKDNFYNNLTMDLNDVNYHTCFSHDGGKIVFNSIHLNNSEIFIMDCNGKNQINLTNHPSWDQVPSF